MPEAPMMYNSRQLVFLNTYPLPDIHGQLENGAPWELSVILWRKNYVNEAGRTMSGRYSQARNMLTRLCT